MEVESGFHRSA